MRTVTIKKSGDEYIVAIPAFAIKQQQLELGAELEFDMDGTKLVFTPIKEKNLHWSQYWPKAQRLD